MMRLCLRCFSLWPGGAEVCGRCRRTLGIRRCPDGHPNPLWAATQTCLTCGQGPLSEGAMYLPLGGIASLLALGVLIFASRWLWHHPGSVFSSLWQSGTWTIGLFLNEPPHLVRQTLVGAFFWYVTLWLFSYLLPDPTGRSARQFLRTLPRHLWHGIQALMRGARALLLPRHRAQGNGVRSSERKENRRH